MDSLAGYSGPIATWCTYECYQYAADPHESTTKGVENIIGYKFQLENISDYETKVYQPLYTSTAKYL